MVYDIDMLRSFYSNFPKRVDAAREPVSYTHLTLPTICSV